MGWVWAEWLRWKGGPMSHCYRICAIRRHLTFFFRRNVIEFHLVAYYYSSDGGGGIRNSCKVSIHPHPSALGKRIWAFTSEEGSERAVLSFCCCIYIERIKRGKLPVAFFFLFSFPSILLLLFPLVQDLRRGFFSSFAARSSFWRRR